MGEELGRIEKPEVASFGEGRKLYLVPLLFRPEDAPPDYSERFDLYWQQVKEHVANLEAKLGQVSRVYHESITATGEDGLKVMERLSPSSCQIVREKRQNGAQLEATEDKELAEESMDWERCLLTGFVSEKVLRRVSEFYIEASRKRYEHIAKRMDETLQAGEAAALFIREGHGVQFPLDIQVFSVAPPALDQIHRWLRERTAAPKGEEGERGS